MAEFLAQGKHDEALALFDAIDPEEAGTTGIRLLKASVLSSAGRPAEGRAIAQEVLSKEPGNIDALMVLATAEGASGKEKEQRAILEQVIKSDPANAEALIGLGGIAFRAKSYRAAGSYYDRVLETEPDSMDALLGRALVYRYGRDPQNAEELLNRAVTLYPDEAAPRSERARLYKNEGYQKQALIDLDAAKKIDGQNYWIAVDRGSVLIDLGRKQEALEEFKRAIELEPGNFLAYVYSAGIKDEIKDYDGAEHDFAILAKLKPDYYFASEGLGMHKMRKQLWAEARDAFMDAYRYAPNEPSYALLAAMNWMRAGKISDPRQFLEQALRKVQRESLEWYMLRLYHDLAGDNDLVIKIDKEKNPERKARMLYYLANYYDIRGNRSLADKYFLQVQSLDVKTIPEWRLNVWTVAERGLALD
jgi:tetratricopeptide (TPR) repeat protein